MRFAFTFAFAVSFGLTITACFKSSATTDMGGDAAIAPSDLTGLAADLSVNDDGALPLGDLSAGVDNSVPGPCNVVTQNGCTGPQKCSYTDPNAGPVMAACVADGTELTGGACNGNGGQAGDCIGANICLVETSTVNICRHWCNDDTDCPGIAPVGANSIRAWCQYPLAGYPTKLCTVPCNPMAALGDSGCATGLGCRYFISMRDSVASEATDCGEMGTKTSAMTCATTSECAPGLVCVAFDSGATTCRAICRHELQGADMTMPPDCAGNEICAGIGTIPDPVFGACIPAT